MISDQELVILGLLKDGPKHGYEIKNKLRQIMEIFAGWDTKSIYYPLRIMEKEGLVTKKVSRVGKRPQRYTYHISPKGENRFSGLLNKSFVTINRPRFNIDLSLYFLPYVSPKNIIHKLTIRLKMLKRIKFGLKNLKKSNKIKLYHQLAIINHNVELIETEIKFVSELITNQRYFSLAKEKR